MSNMLRFPRVKAKVGGLSRSTIWRLEQNGQFPKRHTLSNRIVLWDEDEINAWIKARQTEKAVFCPGGDLQGGVNHDSGK